MSTSNSPTRSTGRRRSRPEPSSCMLLAGSPKAIRRWLRQRTRSKSRRGAREVVGGDQDRAALGVPARRAAHAKRPRVGRVHPGERLVEQQQVGVLGGGLGQQRALALASGEVAEAPPGEVLDPQQRQARRDEFAVALAEAPPPAEVAVAPHPHDVVGGDREGAARGRAAAARTRPAGEASEIEPRSAGPVRGRRRTGCSCRLRSARAGRRSRPAGSRRRPPRGP